MFEPSLALPYVMSPPRILGRQGKDESPFAVGQNSLPVQHIEQRLLRRRDESSHLRYSTVLYPNKNKSFRAKLNLTVIYRAHH